ncbi:hypothetical protein SS50377_20244 [Spironucleus salmonicida]|uniref:Uncharacterized protein n=1 Tax=Spironucleus salmonicida TaxID=348837 RepID=V6LM55_9EUKA|nr:hypothetical protein SS50377_20244 [Spironucleus salmonicida]|eukprot:EST45298.1 Hypothetical protein SS50377_14875 [Spironucleus salmonicida]
MSENEESSQYSDKDNYPSSEDDTPLRKLVIVRLPIITDNPIYAPSGLDVQQFVDFGKQLEFDLGHNIYIKPVMQKRFNEYIIEDSEIETTIIGKQHTFIDFLTPATFVLPDEVPQGFQNLQPNLVNWKYSHSTVERSVSKIQNIEVRNAIIQVLKVRPIIVYRLLEIIFINFQNFEIKINGLTIPKTTPFVLKRELAVLAQSVRIQGSSYHLRQDVQPQSNFHTKRVNVKNNDLWKIEFIQAIQNYKGQMKSLPIEAQILINFFMTYSNQKIFCTSLNQDAYVDKSLVPINIKYLIDLLNGRKAENPKSPFKAFNDILQSEQDRVFYKDNNIEVENLIFEMKLI